MSSLLFILAAAIAWSSGQVCLEGGGEVTRKPENETIPLGQNGTFLCKTCNDYITWRISSYTGSYLDTDYLIQNPVEASKLEKEHGIFITTTQDGINYTSELIITPQNTDTVIIRCSAGRNFNATPVYLRIYGPPTLPKARLESSSRGDSVLLAFSWSPSFSPYSIPVTYKVAVENGSGGNMFSNHTKSTSFLYTPPGGFCSTLTFKVFATNEAGKSNVSAIEYSELAKPNSHIASSPKHTIQLLRKEEMTCDIEFDINPALDCPAYPVTRYTLILQEDRPNGRLWMLGPTFKEPRFTINSSIIEENARYTYRIRFTNDISLSAETKEEELFTTDVTKPIAVISNSSVTVRCSFISGTRCKGCYVKFMDGNSTLMDRYIARKNMSNTAEEKFFFTGIENIREFSILVFDWESTNITGNLAWPALITMHASTTVAASLGAITLPEVTSINLILIISISVTGVALVIAILMLIIITCLLCNSKKKRGTNVSQYQSPRPKDLTPQSPKPYEIQQTCINESLYDQPEDAVISSSHHINRRKYTLENGRESTTAGPLNFSMPMDDYSEPNIRSEEDPIYSHLDHSLNVTSPDQTKHADHYSHLEVNKIYAVLENVEVPSTPAPSPVPPPVPRRQSQQPPEYSEINTLPRRNINPPSPLTPYRSISMV